jgi:hypothetical protein
MVCSVLVTFLALHALTFKEQLGETQCYLTQFAAIFLIQISAQNFKP